MMPAGRSWNTPDNQMTDRTRTEIRAGVHIDEDIFSLSAFYFCAVLAKGGGNSVVGAALAKRPFGALAMLVRHGGRS